MLNKPNQREGSVSNAHVGTDFEVLAQNYFANQGVLLKKNHSLAIGVSAVKKAHRFDLGSDSPFIIVECKSHRWTTGNNIPSAKMSVWNEAMLYFQAVPMNYRKIMFVLRDYSLRRQETLLDYYLRTYGHLVPEDVEFLEFDETTGLTRAITPKH